MMSALALDLGTTAIKAGRLRPDGRMETVTSIPAPALRGGNGRFESDATVYLERVEQLLDRVVRRGDGNIALGISCQRSSFLLWRSSDGEPVTPLISWQDNRGAEVCKALGTDMEELRRCTGLRPTPYYFGPKLCALLRAKPAWKDALVKGDFKVGTLDTFLLWHWTAERFHRTDASMAARTLLMDIRLGKWSPSLCRRFDIPLDVLPEIGASMGLNLPLCRGPCVTACVADQSAALYAALGIGSDEALVNLGTGGFVIRRLDAFDCLPANGYLRTLVHRDAKGTTDFALEGTINSIAAALSPYPCRSCEPEDLGKHPGIFCVVEPSGIGAPFFRNDIGLSFSEPVDRLPPKEIAALLLEGILFRVVRILEDFHRLAPLRRVYLAGGLSELRCLREGLSRLAPFPVCRVEQKEASLYGAALMALQRPPATCRKVESVAEIRDNGTLRRKYEGWKSWLDERLRI